MRCLVCVCFLKIVVCKDDIHQDELNIASSTFQEILHIVKGKYKINIIPNIYLESDFPYDPGGAMICQGNI